MNFKSLILSFFPLIGSVESSTDNMQVFDKSNWNDSILTVKEVEAHHTGNYLCEADNGISPKLRKIVYVRVIGKIRELK